MKKQHKNNIQQSNNDHRIITTENRQREFEESNDIPLHNPQPDSRQILATTKNQQQSQRKSDHNKTVAGHAQQYNEVNKVPLYENACGGHFIQLHDYTFRSKFSMNPSQQKQQSDGDYELSLHEHHGATDGEHAYDKINLSNEPHYDSI
jgi:hypothetical protein